MQLYFPNENVGRLLAAFLVAVVLFRPEQSWPDNKPAAAPRVAEAAAADGLQAAQGKIDSGSGIYTPIIWEGSMPVMSGVSCEFGGPEGGTFLIPVELEPVDSFLLWSCTDP